MKIKAKTKITNPLIKTELFPLRNNSKRQKALENYSSKKASPINLTDKFGILAGSKPKIPTPSQPTASAAITKILPVTLKFKENYNQVVQDVIKKYPKSDIRLIGEYLKIYSPNDDEHCAITTYIDDIGEEFFVFPPLSSRPQKTVIKGLPISTVISVTLKKI
ncbi:hypothetical protein TNCT_309691 [Trichonephila clavata]|uniref:Uncharacterized protein n=1 Tax=Trichonephila clavata TaxID=2740835 RepID=A0A8X6FXE3_TRICU|nr:hypothetical protein TNCT_309691 [Trichonephila clavata]